MNKENPVRVGGGCNCNRRRLNAPNNLELPPSNVLADRWKSKNALRDITSEKNRIICDYPRVRSKSSNEGNVQTEDMVVTSTPHKKRTSSVTTATASYDKNAYVQRNVNQRPYDKQKEFLSYENVVKREIREILEDKQPNSYRRQSHNQPEPANFVTSSPLTYGCGRNKNINKLEVPNSNNLFGAQKRNREYFCSTAIESEKENFASAQYAVNPTRNSRCQIESALANRRKYYPKENIVSNCVPVSVDWKRPSHQAQLKRKEQYEQGVQQNGVQHKTERPIPVVNVYSTTSRAPTTRKISQRQFSYSPILPNRFTSVNTLISKRPERLRGPKVTKRSNKRSYQMWNGAFVGDIYNEEYLVDIFENIKKQEPIITLKENFLHNHNPDLKCRAGVINWLLKEQTYLDFCESEYYLAVNLLDHVLTNIHVPLNMYQLVMISTLSIAVKLIGTSPHRCDSAALVGLCDGAYLTQQLLKMEQKVLHIMNFNLHTTEPSICVNYYLKLFRLQDNDLATLSVYYVLDSFSLTPEFSSTPVSILAAACVKYILIKYYTGAIGDIDSLFRMILTQEDLDKMKSVEAQIFLQLMNMRDEQYGFKEPFNKYSRNKNPAT